MAPDLKIDLNQVVEHFQAHWNEHLEDLKTLVRIPSVSFDGFPPEKVVESAQAVAALMKKRGLENVEIMGLTGTTCHPYVYAEKIISKELPTLLLYAHHDVQPPGREDVWQTPPFEPTEKKGPGGARLFARGAADDKAGIIVHTSAISSFLATAKSLPVNVKVLIEGEEEIGSSHLETFLTKHREKLQADVLVLTDTTNYDVGIPALTVALRGLIVLNVEMRALTKTVHSGMWGGPLPDPAMGLAKCLSKLTDDQGKIAVQKIRSLFRPPSAQQLKEFEALPYDEKEFREQCGMVPSAKILREGPSVMAQLWWYPSLTINGIQASQKGKAGNIINDTAWARVGLRLPPGLDAKQTEEALVEAIRENTPWGLEVKIEVETGSGGWSTNPYEGKGKIAFEAAARALKKAYGKEPLKIGCGGSIPFVQPFADALGGAPALLVGVEDPFTNAHGENESVCLADLKSACLGQIYLFSELGEHWKK